jgi:uncharacterized membrane protein
LDIDPRRKAQRRADRIALFRAELAELEREQGLILTPEQRSRLDAHLEGVLSALSRQFGVDATESAKRISWGMRVASTVGGVALGTAVVLFLHRFWGSVPAPAHVAILAAIPLLLLAGAELAFRCRVDLYYTALLGVAAAVGFVMELSALGTVMNLTPSPHALLAWALFAILVAYAYGLRLLLGAGLLLICAYTAAVWIAAQGGYWDAFLDQAQFMIPAAALLYAVPWLTRHRDPHDFGFVYRACGTATGLTALLLSSTSGHLCCLGVTARVAEVLCQIAGMVVSAGIVFHGLRLGRSGLVNLGALAFVVFLYVRLYSWWWHWMPKYLFFFLIGLTAIALLLIFRRLRTRLSERAMP